MRGFPLVFQVDAATAAPDRLGGAWFRTTQDADTRHEFDDYSTHYQRHDDDVHADHANDDECRYLGGKASATTRPGEPPTMSTVTDRDTATDAGSQLADEYHVVMFSTTRAV
jgi:hypothetical protein